MTNLQTPKEYVERHPLSVRLKRLGVTDEQLKAMRFRGTNQGWPFDQWTFTWLADTPPAAIPLIKDYCTLKWLLLEDPPSSRDREDAYLALSLRLAAPSFELGLKHREAQRARAQKPRGKATEDGKTLNQVIEEIARDPEHQDETPKELWPQFHAKLEELQLSPEEVLHPNDHRKCAYQYSVSSNRRRKITYGRFANIVSRTRRKKKSH